MIPSRFSAGSKSALTHRTKETSLAAQLLHELAENPLR